MIALWGLSMIQRTAERIEMPRERLRGHVRPPSHISHEAIPPRLAEVRADPPPMLPSTPNLLTSLLVFPLSLTSYAVHLLLQPVKRRRLSVKCEDATSCEAVLIPMGLAADGTLSEDLSHV